MSKPKQSASLSRERTSTPARRWKVRFCIPFVFALLENGFSFAEVLDKNDLKKGEIFADASKLSDRPRRGPETHWVCLETGTANLSIRCDDLGINELEGPMAE